MIAGESRPASAIRGHLPAWLAVAMLGVAIGHLAWLLSFADKGFDLCDESTNVLPAMFPLHQVGELTLAGDLTQFLWMASDSSIPLFRLLGIGILLCCVLNTAASAIVYGRSTGLGGSRTSVLYVLAAAIGTIPFFYRNLYVLSPGYNWLTMIGLLGVQAGFFLLLAGRSGAGTVVAIGAGGFLAAAGKPTSGIAILVLLALACLLARDRRKYLGVLGKAIALASVMGLACVEWLGGGIIETYGKLSLGMEYYRIAQTGHTIHHTLGLLFGSLLVPPWKVFLFTQKITIAALLLVVVASWRLAWRSRYAIASLLVLSMFELSLHDISYGTYTFYLASSFVLSLLLVVVSFGLILRTPQGKPTVPLRAVLLPLLFGLFISVAHVFGTNNGPAGKLLLPTVSIALPLVMVGRWAEIRLGQRGIVATIAFAAVFSGAVLLHRSAADPTDRESIAAEIEPVTFADQSDSIRMDSRMASYARTILRVAASAGWREGTPLLNLTGHSPGANVILGAPFIAAPVLIGTVENRGPEAAAARFLVAHASAELVAKAWILTSNGERSLDPRIVLTNGHDFPCGYRLAAEFPSYENAYGNEGPPDTHQLWRPDSSARCTDRGRWSSGGQ